MVSLALLLLLLAAPTRAQEAVVGYPMTNANIRVAVRECAIESQVGGTGWVPGDGVYIDCTTTGQYINTYDWRSHTVTCDASFDCPSSQETYGAIETWNTSLVTCFTLDASNACSTSARDGLFAFMTGFNKNINAWNTAAVTIFAGMFLGATAFDQDLTGWTPTTAMTDVTNMFSHSAFSYDVRDANGNPWGIPFGGVRGAHGLDVTCAEWAIDNTCPTYSSLLSGLISSTTVGDDAQYECCSSTCPAGTRADEYGRCQAYMEVNTGMYFGSCLWDVAHGDIDPASAMWSCSYLPATCDTLTCDVGTTPRPGTTFCADRSRDGACDADDQGTCCGVTCDTLTCDPSTSLRADPTTIFCATECTGRFDISLNPCRLNDEATGCLSETYECQYGWSNGVSSCGAGDQGTCCTVNSCRAKSWAEWLSLGCRVYDESGTTVAALGDLTVQYGFHGTCDVQCLTDGGEFTVSGVTPQATCDTLVCGAGTTPYTPAHEIFCDFSTCDAILDQVNCCDGAGDNTDTTILCSVENPCPAGSFCNFDGGDSGRCEMCSDCGGLSGCYDCGLPTAGGDDCMAACGAPSRQSASSATVPTLAGLLCACVSSLVQLMWA